MPPLARFFVRHSVVGCALGVVFVACFLTLNIGSLRTMMQQVDNGVFYMALFTMLTCSTFASAQVSIAVMLKSTERR